MEIERDSPEFEKEVSNLVTGFTEELKCTGSNPKPVDSLGVAHLEKEQFTQPEQILCPRCGSKDIWEYGVRGGVQYYFCEKCKRKFTSKDAPFHNKTPAEVAGIKAPYRNWTELVKGEKTLPCVVNKKGETICILQKTQ